MFFVFVLPHSSSSSLPSRQHRGVNWKIIKLIGTCSLRQVTVCYRRNFVNVSELRRREVVENGMTERRETRKVDQNSMVRNSLTTLAHGCLLHWRCARRKTGRHLTTIDIFLARHPTKDPFYGPKCFSLSLSLSFLLWWEFNFNIEANVEGETPFKFKRTCFIVKNNIGIFTSCEFCYERY